MRTRDLALMEDNDRAKKDERGVVLLLVLFIVTLLTVLVLEFNYATRVEYHIANNFRDEILALNIAKAGVFEKIALLREDRLKDIEEKEEKEEGSGGTKELEKEAQRRREARMGGRKEEEQQIETVDFPDHYGEEWARELYMEPLGDGFLSVKVIDESGKFNINRLVKEQREVTTAAKARAKEEEKRRKALAKTEEGDEETEEESEQIRLPRRWGQKDEDWDEEEMKAREVEEEVEYERPARYVVDRDVEKVIIRLIETLDVRKVDPEEVVPAIIDWMDSNDTGDWEEEEYTSGGDGSPPKNAPLDVLSELLMIHGVTGDLYYGPKQPETVNLEEMGKGATKRKRGGAGLRDCLTVYSQTRVNVNTAPPEVLTSLLDEENEALVKEIVSYTKKDYFEDLQQFEEEIGEHVPASFMAKIGVGSDSFQIISEGQVNEVKRQIRAYVSLDEDSNVRILYWKVEGQRT
jgi:type II secretory pathway component PulK